MSFWKKLFGSKSPIKTQSTVTPPNSGQAPSEKVQRPILVANANNYAGAEYDIFLSHNNADKAWTERLATAIEADNSGPPLRVFFDKWDIQPGADIPAELEEGLQSSRYIGLVLSPESLASDWVSLERSTAIYRDPSARSHHLIPLLRRECDIPDMLARLKYIDFRREQDFEASVTELIDMLRGRPRQRGQKSDTSDIYFREDAALLRRYRQIFDRAAFKMPCIMELFIHQLLQAIDDTIAAINTGSLYSRSKNLLSTFPDRNEYRLPEFKQAFSHITAKLTELQRIVVEFEEYFRRVNPGYSHHENFYAMLMGFWYDPGRDFWSEAGRGSTPTPDKMVIQRLVGYMDQIDIVRNDVLTELNVLLEKCGESTFEPIQLTSNILRTRHIGGADKVAELLE
jgi:hypothetical protein